MALLAACGGEAAEASLDDKAGVVTDHAFYFEPADLGADDGLFDGVDPLVDPVVTGPVDGADLRVWWYGTPCQTAPTVTVSQRGEGLEVSVERGPQVGLRANEVCPDVGVGHALDLVLDRGIAPEDVDARYAPRE